MNEPVVYSISDLDYMMAERLWRQRYQEPFCKLRVKEMLEFLKKTREGGDEQQQQ